MARDGWVKIWHKLAEDPMWLERSFTPGQAWVDLILIARIMTDKQHQPGQVCCSVSYLARRWKWSRPRVDRYLKRLERDEKITVHKNVHRNEHSNEHLLSIVKYARYQKDEQANEQANKQNPVHKEDDTSARSANAGGDGAVGVVPGPFREFFATWEEYDEWRRTNS